jgi:hypothetical protein
MVSTPTIKTSAHLDDAATTFTVRFGLRGILFCDANPRRPPGSIELRRTSAGVVSEVGLCQRAGFG